MKYYINTLGRGVLDFFLQVRQLGNGFSASASQCVAKSVFFTSTQSYNYIFKGKNKPIGLGVTTV